MPRTYRARVTSKGQLTVPKAVRRALGIDAGDEVVFDVGPDAVTIAPAPRTGRFAAVEGRWRSDAGASPEAVDAWLRDLRGHRDDPGEGGR